MDIVDVLKMLARQNGLNIVIGKGVSGRVTVSLSNVDFWQAFHTILGTRDLAYSREGDLIDVMTASDYEKLYGTPFDKRTQLQTFKLQSVEAAIAKAALDPLKSKVGTITVDETSNSLIVDDTPASIKAMTDRLAVLDAPLERRVFHLNYATAEDIQPKVASLVSKDLGNLQIDKRSNVIVVQDNPVRMKEIEDLIKAIDVRDKTVLIEAKIMQITLNQQFQMGVNWQGVDWTYIFNKLNGYHVAGTLVQNLQLVNPATVTGKTVTAPGITAQIGVLEKPNFQAVINALDTIGKTKILSSPRVTAINRQEAKIHVGSKAPKITTSLINAGSTTTSPITTVNVDFLDVGVKLAVTPIISDDRMITMKVKPEVSSVLNTITLADGSSIPVIQTSEAEASLVVKDGVTVVLGGLMEDDKSNTDNTVPFLGRIPILGMLFRNRNKTDQRTELVIFLTPHIVDGDMITPEVQNSLDLQPNGQPRKKGFWKRLFSRKSDAEG
jgi:general secretion pathway protein D